MAELIQHTVDRRRLLCGEQAQVTHGGARSSDPSAQEKLIDEERRQQTGNSRIYGAAKALAVLGVLLMASVLIYGFNVGNFGAEGQVLLSMPWGIVSLVDVYIGFILFSGWIVYREKSLVRSIVWVALVMVLGNLTACLYVLIALIASRGNWRRFWLGNRLDDGCEQS